MAACTVWLESTESSSKRRCERSGPTTAARMRRKCTPKIRLNLRASALSPAGAAVPTDTLEFGALESIFSARISERSTGSASCTKVVRPLKSIPSRRRKRPTTTQSSANSTLNQPVVRSGARPTNTLTGTSCTVCPNSLCKSANRRSSRSWRSPTRALVNQPPRLLVSAK